ncbi:MAG: hypothetical protein Q8O97_01840, partial [bacterium]|nr:hypothetical protein [bacterium]
MKFCFLINSAPFLSEFLGKISSEALNDNHEVVVVVNSKVAEYTKKQHFPEQVRWISKVDWCVEHFDPSKKEFGSFSWREFFPAFGRYTRLRWDYAYSVDTVSQLCQFFDFVFRTEKPDIVLGEPPTGVFGNIAHHFAKQYKVPALGLTDSRLNIAVYDSESNDSRFEKTFKKLFSGDIEKSERAALNGIIKKIVSHVEKPAYMNYAKISFSPITFVLHYFSRLSELGPVFRYLRNRAKFKPYDYESEVTWRRTFSSPIELLWRQFRLFSQKRFFSLMNEHDQFFVYPLHLEPEAATLVLAAPYADQMATIRSIAFSLPFPFKLYVKEHPSAMGLRPDGFYQELQKVPN